MLSPKINLYKNHLLTLSIFLLFGSLSVSKGLQTICEVSIIALSLDKIFLINSWKKIRSHQILFIFGLLYLALILGLLYSENLSYGLKVIRHNHRWFVIPFLFLLHKDLIQKWYKQLLLTFVLTAGLASAITIVLFYVPQEVAIWVSEHVPLIQQYPYHIHESSFGIYSPFVDRLQFSNLIGVASLFLWFGVIRKWFPAYTILVQVPIIYCSIILGGRGGQISLALGSLIYFFLIARNFLFPYLAGKFNKAIAGIIIFIGVILIISSPILVYKTSNSLRSRYDQLRWELSTFQDNSYKNYDYVHFTSVRRIISWKHLIELFKENPIIGVGTGDIYDELKVKYDQDPYPFPVNIHSQFLYYAAAIGGLGLLIFLFCCFIWARQFVHTEYMNIALVFLIFYATTMFFNASLVKQVDLMAFSVITSYLTLRKK